MITGRVVSLTMKLAKQVTIFPEASDTVITIDVVPVETIVPAGGNWVIINDGVGVQLSVAIICAVKSGTVAWHPASANAD